MTAKLTDEKKDALMGLLSMMQLLVGFLEEALSKANNPKWRITQGLIEQLEHFKKIIGEL